MAILDLVKEIDQLKKNHNSVIRDLHKSYVPGSDAFKKQAEHLEAKYQADTEAIRNKINMELAKVEAKAKTIQTIHAATSTPTQEELDAGYKVVDMISKTSHSISEETLSRLVSKVKDFDQLAVIKDVVASTGEIGLKNIVKSRIQDLDAINTQQQDKLQLVKDFDQALAASNDELTFDVMALASALDKGDMND